MNAVYADWKAPPHDGQFLIWPSPQAILADTQSNHQALQSPDALIQNVPLSELRRGQRGELNIHEDMLVLAGGHQTELYHAGVWAKDALACSVAEKLGGQAWHLAVDTDQPKHLTLRWPGGSEPITDDSHIAAAAWSGLLHAPSTSHLEQMARSLPVLREWLSFLQPDASLSQTLTVACHKLDQSVGLNVHRLLVSSLLDSEPYLVLAHHQLARADAFALQYNAALGDYRKSHKIRSAARPMPDLLLSADECEAPFWLDDIAAGTRHRASVRRIGEIWTLIIPGGERFTFDPAAQPYAAAASLRSFLDDARLRLAPRALTLTLFFRLLVADQFIHGIGGGRYDQVTDALIARHFGLRPPKFCVTTATLLFPGAAEKKRISLPQMLEEGRRLRHGLLGEEKMKRVDQIAALPRGSSGRRTLFDQMRHRLDADATDHAAIKDWESRFAAAKSAGIDEEALWDREYFYAIQPPERLKELLGKYQAQFARTGSVV
jgi:hypothetical protein